MTFIQAGMRQKQGSESVHRPENGRRSASELVIKFLLETDID